MIKLIKNALNTKSEIDPFYFFTCQVNHSVKRGSNVEQVFLHLCIFLIMIPSYL